MKRITLAFADQDPRSLLTHRHLVRIARSALRMAHCKRRIQARSMQNRDFVFREVTSYVNITPLSMANTGGPRLINRPGHARVTCEAQSGLQHEDFQFGPPFSTTCVCARALAILCRATLLRLFMLFCRERRRSLAFAQAHGSIQDRGQFQKGHIRQRRSCTLLAERH